MARGVDLPARLLVDLPNWVGDVAMALPAAAHLAEVNAGATTVLHCRPAVGRLLASLVPTARVVATPRRSSPLAAARRLRGGAGRFAAAVTFRHSARARLLLLFAARRRVGSNEGPAAMLMNRRVTLDRTRHQVEDGARLLAGLGVDPPAPGWRPGLSAELMAEGRAALDAAGIDLERGVGLIVAAAWGASKQWPVERFGGLAARLAGAGLEPVVLVGPGEEGVARGVVEAAGRPLAVIGPELDVAALTGVLAHLGAVVSNDTGPMHLAALAGARVVALFGPTDARRTAPVGPDHVVLARDLECAPCFAPSCPLGHHRCMLDIGVDEVEAATLRVLGRA